jgi:outer membrane lipoprotein-sorting protein
VRRRSLSRLALAWRIALTGLAVCATGCAVSQKHAVPPAQVHPALEATKDQLIAQYNRQANAIRSLNATVDMIPTAGSTYSGVIEEYHDVNGFILAEKPAKIRLIGQAPVVAKTIFDMVSDGETFRIFIPSKNEFIVGPANLERAAKKPIENLRPQHLVDALFWPPASESAPVLFEEWNETSAAYYVLTLLREAIGEPSRGTSWEIERKIWFDRADLSIVRLETYGPAGRLLSDIHYSDWEPVDERKFPRDIRLARPHDDYQLEVRIVKLTLNEPMSDRFSLAQPPGTELVKLGADPAEPKP